MHAGVLICQVGGSTPQCGEIMATLVYWAETGREVADAALEAGHHELRPLLQLGLALHWVAQAAASRQPGSALPPDPTGRFEFAKLDGNIRAAPNL